MTVVETITQKIVQLPPKAQEEVLEMVEHIESRYSHENIEVEKADGDTHPLDMLLKISIDGPADLSERHDFYAHGKLGD